MADLVVCVSTVVDDTSVVADGASVAAAGIVDFCELIKLAVVGEVPDVDVGVVTCIVVVGNVVVAFGAVDVKLSTGIPSVTAGGVPLRVPLRLVIKPIETWS